jgi:aminoglycoside phosphotransferase
VQPLRHSYTNDTRGNGTVVVKRYEGPDPVQRCRREQAMLDRLRGRVPVAPLLGGADAVLRMGFVGGVHGQELIAAGRAAEVLRACGETLRALHAVDPAVAFPAADDAPSPGSAHSPAAADDLVIVHGDYGPNNMLLDPDSFAVTAVLDWEWAHPGRRIEDLAWCEWIVRMHHPEHRAALGAFFTAYGDHPPWPERRHEMLARCRALLDLCVRRAGDDRTDGAVRQWRHRVALTNGWTE